MSDERVEAPTPADGAPPAADATTAGAWPRVPGAQDGVVAWTTRIPLLGNRFIWWDMLRVAGLSVLLMQVALLAMALFVNGADDLGDLVLPPLVLLGVVGVMMALFVIACLVLLNRIGAWFGVGPAGVAWATGRRERALDTATVVVGALAGNLSAMGAGLLAKSSESSAIEWRDVRRAVFHEGAHVISVRNSWRTVVRLYCRPEDWDAVRMSVEAGLAVGARQRAAAAPLEAAARRGAHRPWWSYALWILVPVAGVVVAGAWPWLDYDEVGRWIVLAGLATLAAGVLEGPLRRVMGAAGVVLAGWLIAVTLLEAFADSGLSSGAPFPNWTLDTGLLALGLGGQVLLLAMSGWRLFAARRGASRR